MKKIIIHVEGGIIQQISDIPKGVEVEVRDYDTDGTDADRLTDTPDGQAIVSTWSADQ